jgi:Uma2 family endonuclease
MTDINQLDMTKSYTYADYLTWEFDEMVELIKGKIFRMSPAPIVIHQVVANAINNELYFFFKGTKCRVFIAPFDVRLVKKGKDSKSINTVVQPDICVICDLEKLDEFGCVGAPDLIVEVASPGTIKKDYNEKFNLYEENGIKEYWIANPKSKTIEVYTLLNNEYKLHAYYEKSGETIMSPLFEGFATTWDDIFADL